MLYVLKHFWRHACRKRSRQIHVTMKDTHAHMHTRARTLFPTHTHTQNTYIQTQTHLSIITQIPFVQERTITLMLAHGFIETQEHELAKTLCLWNWWRHGPHVLFCRLSTPKHFPPQKWCLQRLGREWMVIRERMSLVWAIWLCQHNLNSMAPVSWQAILLYLRVKLLIIIIPIFEYIYLDPFPSLLISINWHQTGGWQN